MVRKINRRTATTNALAQTWVLDDNGAEAARIDLRETRDQIFVGGLLDSSKPALWSQSQFPQYSTE